MKQREAETPVAPGLRVGRGLELSSLQFVGVLLKLRPAFGSGEDWNIYTPPSLRSRAVLRPAFGSGEDWNIREHLRVGPRTVLRPAFGSGEDWNTVYFTVDPA